MSRELTGDLRAQIAEILETVARDGLPGPRDLDVALDAIGCAIYDDEDSRSAWRPIETAPKDGTRILAVRVSWWTPVNGNHRWICDRIIQTRWCDRTQCFDVGDSAPPTHWMPLPPYSALERSAALRSKLSAMERALAAAVKRALGLDQTMEAAE